MGAFATVPDLASAGSLRSRRWDGRAAAITIGVSLAVSLVVAVLLGAVPAPAGLAVASLVPAAIVDLRERRLPDVWVGSSAAVLVIAWMANWAIGSAPEVGAAMLGTLVVAGPILLLHLLTPAAMGFGDVKAAVVIGLAVGSVDWQLALVALTLAAGSAGAVGIALRLRTIPFGPFLVVGAWLALIAQSIWLAPLESTPVVP